MRVAQLTALTSATALLFACIPDDPPVPHAAASDAPAPTAAKTGEAPPKADALGNMSPAELLAHVEGMKDQVRKRDRGYDINVLLGNLYFENNKYIDSIEFLSDGLRLATSVEQRLLAHKATSQPAPAACRIARLTPVQVQKGEEALSFEEVSRVADTLSPSQGMLCLEQLRASLADAHARRGSAWYLIGNADNAQADHAVALKLDPDNAEALFFSGAAILESAKGDPAQLALGKATWEHLLKVAPDHPRAEFVRQTLPRINELFGPHPEAAMDGHPPMEGPGPLPPGAEDMATNFQHTPENEAELDKITEHGEELLKQSKWGDALDEFKRVMPVRPSGRIALDMGIALRELGKPMAERVLTQASQMPGGDPSRARYELAIYYEKTQPEQAKAIYAELSSDPKVGSDAKARLAKLQ